MAPLDSHAKIELAEEERGALMNTRDKLGFTNYTTKDLEPEALEGISEWYDISKSELMMLDSSFIEELASYLIDSEETHPDCRFTAMLRALLRSGYLCRALAGNDVYILTEKPGRAVSKRLMQLSEESDAELRELDDTLCDALLTVREDGRIDGPVSQALDAWSRAAGTFESFVTKPRHARRVDLEDMLLGLNAMNTLIDVLELFRRLLLAAGVAYDKLAAATLGYFDISGIGHAVDIWRVAEGRITRRLGTALSELAARTPGAEPDCDFPEDVAVGNTAWIAAYSRLGQSVMGWALARDEVILNFVAVGPLWPGPAVYGGDDEEANAYAACKLCSYLSSDARRVGKLLTGSEECIVKEDLTIQLSARFTDGEGSVYLSVATDEVGSYLVGRPAERHFSELARSIRSEMSLEPFAWFEYLNGGEDDPSDIFSFEGSFSLYAYYEKETEVSAGGRVSLTGLFFDELRPGARLTVLGNGDHFEVMGPKQLEKRSEGISDDIAGLFYSEGDELADAEG